MKKTTITKKCNECGKEMTMPFWLSIRKRFCSKLCNGARVRRETEEKYQCVCQTCGKNFKKDHASKGLFCSHKCYSVSLKTRGEKPKCLTCNKTLSAHISLYCKDCFPKFRTGVNHWNWKGGVDLRDFHSLFNPEYVQWRTSVFKRDNFKCKIADCNCSGQLEAHHILPWSEFPELRYQINNGITLCHYHHPRKKFDVKKLSPHFQSLVASLD